jgi:hypothetical protein
MMGGAPSCQRAFSPLACARAAFCAARHMPTEKNRDAAHHPLFNLNRTSSTMAAWARWDAQAGEDAQAMARVAPASAPVVASAATTVAVGKGAAAGPSMQHARVREGCVCVRVGGCWRCVCAYQGRLAAPPPIS